LEKSVKDERKFCVADSLKPIELTFRKVWIPVSRNHFTCTSHRWIHV